MDEKELVNLLDKVKNGQCAIDDAVFALKRMGPGQHDFACLDHHRRLRTGIPEVIFGENKSAEQISIIFEGMLGRAGVVMATRVSAEKARLVCGRFPDTIYYEEARMIVGGKADLEDAEDSVERPLVAVLAAGTSDLPVAEEARLTAVHVGCRVESAYDIGIAGIHRLYARHELLFRASVLIVVAGMEGALPGVVAGLVEAPVIAVPTSVGYGTGFGGIAALLGMLNSCAPGMAVVNIDNGFGAGCMASKIAKMAARVENK